MARYQMIQLIDTALQPLSWLVCLVLACGSSNIGSGQRQSGPFGKLSAGCNSHPWAARACALARRRLFRIHAELQWLLARRAGELSPHSGVSSRLLKISVYCNCSPHQSVSNTLNILIPNIKHAPKPIHTSKTSANSESKMVRLTCQRPGPPARGVTSSAHGRSSLNLK